jgi:hypothetical protein
VWNNRIIFWGNSYNSRKIFTSQKKIIRIMACVKPGNSCRNLLKRLEILTLPCEYMFSSVNFIINNQDHLRNNSALHSVSTRSRHEFHRPVVKLSCFWKSAYYSVIKIFNKLPCGLKSLMYKNMQFKSALKDT